MIPLSVPSLKGNELKYVTECIETEWISSAGKYVEQFEEKLAAFVGARHAVACVNGTAALQVALELVGVRSGDLVIVPSLTFIATVNVVHYVSAEPVFMDCDEFYNIDPEKTAEYIRQNTEFRDGFSYHRKSGRRVSAIIPVHVLGNAVRMEELLKLCRERNIKIVEDATESLGTHYIGPMFDGRFTGTIGDIGCFSFNGNKIITTGGGGMIVTDNAEYAMRAKYLTTQAKDDEVRYVHNDVGYNFRLNNIQAAVGVAQLESLPDILRAKQSNFDSYRERIARIPGLRLADSPAYARNNHWMYPLQIDSGIYRKTREELMEHLRQKGIQTRPMWHLNHLQKPYRHCEHYRIELALSLLESTLCIPCSANLSPSDIDAVIAGLGDG